MIDFNISKELLGANKQIKLQVSLKIKKGSFLAISGESGSGKTTLLRVLAGLEEAKGKIMVDDDIWLDDKSSLPPQKRDIGFVFQDFALFPNMSVLENLLFVKKDNKLAKYLLNKTELFSLKNRSIQTLSGGQKQRVALCRAMMKRPKILLMDEPLSSLDPSMRVKLQSEILKLHEEFGTTTLFVSHDPAEIYKLCDRVVVLDSAKVIKDTTPKEALLQTSGSLKFSFEGVVLEINRVDAIFIAVVAVGRQISQIAISQNEVDSLKAGDRVRISTKAFAPVLQKLATPLL